MAQVAVALAVALALASSALGNGAKWLQDNAFASGGASGILAPFVLGFEARAHARSAPCILQLVASAIYYASSTFCAVTWAEVLYKQSTNCADVALRAGSAAGGCSLPQGPHTAVLDQRQVTDPDAGDMQAFMLRRVPCPVMYSPCKSSISEVLKHVTSTLLVPHSWLDSLQSGPH